MRRLTMAASWMAAILVSGTCASAQDGSGPTVSRVGDRIEVSEPIRFKGKEVHPDSLDAITALAEYLKAHPEMQLSVVVGDPGVKDRDKAMEHTRYLAQRVVYALEDCWIGEGRVTPRGLGYSSKSQVLFPIAAPAAEPPPEPPEPTTISEPSAPAVTVTPSGLDGGPPMGSEDETPPAPDPDAVAVGEVIELVMKREAEAEAAQEGDFCAVLTRVLEAAPGVFEDLRSGEGGATVMLPGARSCHADALEYGCLFLETKDLAQGEARFEEIRGQLMQCLPWTWAFTDEPVAMHPRFFMALGPVGESSVQLSLGLVEPFTPGDTYTLSFSVEIPR